MTLENFLIIFKPKRFENFFFFLTISLKQFASHQTINPSSVSRGGPLDLSAGETDWGAVHVFAGAKSSDAFNVVNARKVGRVRNPLSALFAKFEFSSLFFIVCHFEFG